MCRLTKRALQQKRYLTTYAILHIVTDQPNSQFNADIFREIGLLL